MYGNVSNDTKSGAKVAKVTKSEASCMVSKPLSDVENSASVCDGAACKESRLDEKDLGIAQTVQVAKGVTLNININVTK